MSYKSKYLFSTEKCSIAALRQQFSSDQQLSLCEMWQQHYATGILLLAVVRLCKNVQLLNVFYLFQVSHYSIRHLYKNI